MKAPNEIRLPLAASEYLADRFPDGFQFDEVHTEKDTTGHIVHVVLLCDGQMNYEFRFSAQGALLSQDITPVYDGEERIASGEDEFHEDDF